MTPQREWWERSSEGRGEAGRERRQKAKQQQSEPKMRSEQKTNREHTRRKWQRPETDWSGGINIGPRTRVFIDRELFRSFLIGKCLKPNRGKEQKAESENSSETTVPFGRAQSYIFCCLQPTTTSLMCAFLWYFCGILNESELRWSMQLNLQLMVCSIIRQ